MLQVPGPSSGPLTTTTTRVNLVRPDQPRPLDHSWPPFFIVGFVVIVLVFVVLTAIVVHQNRLARDGARDGDDGDHRDHRNGSDG
ncbi:MAG: hypothetical protein JWL73_3874 [Actinomycetia bacterium]|nr:hypothetical protein [Actinomycetes bacterium]